MFLLSNFNFHAGLLAAGLAGGLLTGPPPAHAQAAHPNHPKAAAPAAAKPATLRVEGLVATPRTFSAAELAALPQREQTTTGKDGQWHVYRGVALAEVLRLAGAPAGKAVHGEVLSQAVVAMAADGYRAVFALPEIDPDFAPQVILLANQRDGQPLSAHDGPYQLVVPLEKKPARWVRQLTGLRVVKVP